MKWLQIIWVIATRDSSCNGLGGMARVNAGGCAPEGTQVARGAAFSLLRHSMAPDNRRKVLSSTPQTRLPSPLPSA